MTGTMRAAVYHGPRDIRVENVSKPEPAAGEVLVRVLRSGLCGTDATEWTSGPILIPLTTRHPHSGHVGPMIPGHEIVGEVIAAPPGSPLAIGTIAASGAQIACGECKNCLAGRINVCDRLYTLGLQRHGGHAEYVAGPQEYWVPIPEGLDVDAAGLAQPLGVGLHAARRAHIADDDRVLILGAGAIGTFVLAAVRHLHPSATTEISDIDSAKLERALRLGAAATINAAHGESPEEAAYDVVIEATGAAGMLARSVRYARKGGRVLAVGLSAEPQEIDTHDFVIREVTIESTNALITHEDIPVALEILRDTPLAGELIDSVRPLSTIAEAHEELASGRVQGKILIDPSL